MPDLLPVMQAKFNLREACKQLVLLEDHLNQPRKRCKDCIRKHFLTLEALFEEGASLNGADKPLTSAGGLPVGVVCTRHADLMRTLADDWQQGKPEEEVATYLRAIRKALTPYCFDLRQMKSASSLRSTVASRHLGRIQHFCGR